jgi:hypothetical protein
MLLAFLAQFHMQAIKLLDLVTMGGVRLKLVWGVGKGMLIRINFPYGMVYRIFGCQRKPEGLGPVNATED